MIGSPRSGTTWLQSLLGAHPRIASPQETDLFTRFVTPMRESWDWQMRGTPEDWVTRRLKGLPSLLTSSEFDRCVNVLINDVFAAALALKPGADIVLEKSPSHSLDVATIAHYLPQTNFIHVVRDGRDAVDSMLAASKGWGAFWAPQSVTRAAELWVKYVRGAQAARDQPNRYHEIRYEDLKADGAVVLQRAFHAIGIEASVSECAANIAQHAIGSPVGSPGGSTGGSTGGTGEARSASILVGGEFAAFAGNNEPEGFIRTGKGGGWREWTPNQRLAFNEIAGPLLVELGYASDSSWADASFATRRARTIRTFAAKASRSAGFRLSQRLEPLQ